MAGKHRTVPSSAVGNLAVTACGLYSHRMLRAAVDVLGPDRVMFATDSPYGATVSDGYVSSGCRELATRNTAGTVHPAPC
jgi:predicted TIM-barrel fold metal-dependent hydrolase